MDLQPHPSSPPSPASAIQALATRLADGKLSLVFAVSGDVANIRLPERLDARARRNGLWKHSCFEAFIRLPGELHYVELNFASSGDWAAYIFENYRSGMREAATAAPAIECQRSGNQLGIVVGIDLAGLTDLDPRSPWKLGLSAVMEAQDGSRSYWALAHPQEIPDFHHPDCFVLELPPAGDA
jgi:hypothetical protein